MISQTRPQLNTEVRAQMKPQVKSKVKLQGKSPVRPLGKSLVRPLGKSLARPLEKSPVTFERKSPVTHEGKSPVTLVRKSPVTLVRKSPVTLDGKSPARPQGKSPVRPQGKAQVRPQGKSPVRPQGKSPVRPEGKSPVRPEGKSPVRSEGKSPVRSEGKSPVRPEGKSPVRPVGKSPVRTQGKSPVRHQGKSPVRQVNSPVRHQVNSPVRHQVNSPVTHQVNSPVRHQVNSPVRHQVNSPVRQVKSPVRHQARHHVHHQVKHYAQQQVQRQVKHHGQHQAQHQAQRQGQHQGQYQGKHQSRLKKRYVERILPEPLSSLERYGFTSNITNLDFNQASHRKQLLEPVVNCRSFDKLLASIHLAPGHVVGDNHPCFVIAEIGQNHQGEVNIAERLIDIAVECGADCVKFQKTDVMSRFSGAALAQIYDGPHSFGRTYGEHRQRLEFTDEEFYNLQKYADSKDILFTASGMDKRSVDFLYALNVPFFKVGSADCANYPLLTHTAYYRKPMVISTGMHDFATITTMYNYLRPINSNIALLQCTSSYPTPERDVHLSVMEAFRTRFPFAVIGYSGHETGIGISLAAVALGARILERHITLDHDMKGTDHKCSLNPFEFSNLMYEVRRIEKAMGTAEKAIQESEYVCKKKLAKTAVAAYDLYAGEILTANSVELKVTVPHGWEASKIHSLFGLVLKRDIMKDCSITTSDVTFCKALARKRPCSVHNPESHAARLHPIKRPA